MITGLVHGSLPALDALTVTALMVVAAADPGSSRATVLLAALLTCGACLPLVLRAMITSGPQVDDALGESAGLTQTLLTWAVLPAQLIGGAALALRAAGGDLPGATVTLGLLGMSVGVTTATLGVLRARAPRPGLDYR